MVYRGIYPGVRVTVEIVQPNTPAYGKLNKGDVVPGINGAMPLRAQGGHGRLARVRSRINNEMKPQRF